jgi:demethylmenaquinone methyltransferase/2-methoxy-6-polyprenyl-1,4-benzoquinol methylase
MSKSLAASVNYWPESACAKAFWGQQELPPYRRLLGDTVAWLEPRPGQRWLDLGCGCGQLTEALWAKSRGSLEAVVGLDCAPANAAAFEKLSARVQPVPPPGRIRFVHADFSSGLAGFPANHFDGVVSGLAIQYAESFSAEKGRWTTDAYDRLLHEIQRVLRRGGWFVFSVNVPQPAWGKVALRSLTGVFRTGRLSRYLKNAWRMYRYGSWLTREARRGRFHYLPLETIQNKLAAAGFAGTEHRYTYVGQAYLIRCRKAG